MYTKCKFSSELHMHIICLSEHGWLFDIFPSFYFSFFSHRQLQEGEARWILLSSHQTL